MNDSIDTKVAIAVLEENYRHLDEKITTLHVDTRAAMREMGIETKDAIKELTSQITGLTTQITVQSTTHKIRAGIWTAARHGLTVVGTLALAKILHLPIDPS